VSFFRALGWNSDPIGKPMDEFVAEAVAAGIPVRVTSTRRSAEEQRRLYAQGRTSPGPIVTWTLNSAHVDGRAFDVTIEGAPEYEDDPEAWDLLGELGQGLGLRWGGTFGDYGHFELSRA
jgi:peptidoglycan L-alanyl-D-glutamate endopeptidase CwlK